MNAFAHWISGFAAGEGTFMVRLERRREYIEERYKPCCRFAIGLRDDDEDILQEIRQYFGCGAICTIKRTAGIKSDTKTQARYSVDSLAAQARIIVPHFDRHPLRAKKAADFAVYREAVLFAAEVSKRPRNLRWKSADLERFRKLAERIKEVRRYVW